MTGKKTKPTCQGFTLIELIAAMVLVGVAAALVGTGFMSFTRIGEGKNYARNAQLAQQRMELILAQKRTTSGFSCSEDDLDPCTDDSEDNSLKDKEFCDNEKVEANFTDKGSYCEVKVEIKSVNQEFYMHLYDYSD
jgi:prepilin-type N-terminal cleavage/methylation domain-containing protein